MTDPFVSAVRRTLARYPMFDRGDRVVAAVSGGPDSTALLLALAELVGEWEIEVIAAHLDHGLRGAESARDREAAGRLAALVGVPFRAETLPAGRLADVPGGVEQTARRARYEFLRRVAAETGARRIATGHTRDDQAETVLLRLLRGSRVAGLAGIRPVRGDGVVRPLIDVTREEVRAFLARRGVPAMTDSSNADDRFTRNRIRRDLLPVLRGFNPRIVAHLAALAETCAGQPGGEDALALALLRAHGDAEGGLPVALLGDLPVEARRVLVRVWLGQVRGHLRRIATAHLDALARCGPSGRTVELPGGERVVNAHGVLRFARPEGPPAFPPALLLPGQRVQLGRRWQIEASAVERLAAAPDMPTSLWQAVFDADHLRMPVTVRRWRPGDRMRPLGMRGHRKLSDIFIDGKVPRAARHAVPIVEAGGEIVWVPGLIRSDVAKVAPGTSCVLRLCATRG